MSFPDYGTSIGEEIARALQGERDYGADVMQLLYVANRYERKADLLRWLDGGLILVCDRYTASSIAYGEAQGLDSGMARRDPEIPAAAGADDSSSTSRPKPPSQRKAVDRDRYERDLALQTPRSRQLSPAGRRAELGARSMASARGRRSPPTSSRR